MCVDNKHNHSFNVHYSCQRLNYLGNVLFYNFIYSDIHLVHIGLGDPIARGAGVGVGGGSYVTAHQ